VRGVVYFAATADLKHVKITFAPSRKRAEKRSGDLDLEMRTYRQLITGQGLDSPGVSLLQVIPAESEMELDIHTRFASQRVVGDWFRFDGDLKKFVSKVLEDPNLPLALDIFGNKCDLCGGYRSHRKFCQRARVRTA